MPSSSGFSCLSPLFFFSHIRKLSCEDQIADILFWTMGDDFPAKMLTLQ
ncbi:hypothetical protein HMPREF9374_3139 [Desmospora sp. 8437]|nr:hypothetical protein HMPREF9374_3139 [Desmospora sp. 8437]